MVQECSVVYTNNFSYSETCKLKKNENELSIKPCVVTKRRHISLQLSFCCLTLSLLHMRACTRTDIKLNNMLYINELWTDGVSIGN